MASSHYVNKVAQANGDHEVHRQDCKYLPADHNRIYLGEYDRCQPAVAAAKAYYSQVNGCYFCCNACHTQ